MFFFYSIDLNLSATEVFLMSFRFFLGLYETKIKKYIPIKHNAKRSLHSKIHSNQTSGVKNNI